MRPLERRAAAFVFRTAGMVYSRRMAILNAVVHGGVQGVGFRDFVRRRALEAGISGWVRNRPDGSVELNAVGNRPALERLLEQVTHGPGLAEVHRVEARWAEGGGEADESGFQIRA